MRPTIAVLAGLTLIPAQATAPAPLTDRQVYKIGLDALVGIIVVGDDGFAMGSGAVIGHDAKGRQAVITAAHLFGKDTRGIVVSVSEDVPYETSHKTSRASVLSVNDANDIAVIVLDHDLPRAALHLGSHLAQGDPLYWFGNPDEAPTMFGKGVLTRRNYPGKNGHNAAQYLGMTWPGESGGPILDEFGGLSGVVSAVNAVDDPMNDMGRVLMEDVGYCVQLPAIKAILDKTGVK